ncbi:MAG: redoxin domain-containing protein [Blastomonas sp.]
MMLYPRDPVPPFQAQMLEGGTWKLSEQRPENFVMIVVYRGYQCPLCKLHLTSLNDHIDTLERLGIEAFVVSAERREQVERARHDWGLTKLSMGYGLDPVMGHQWGLYVSQRVAEGGTEAELFFEPGLFLIRGDDQTLYYTSIQNMPFGRPDWTEFTRLMGHIAGTDHLARGNVKLA